MGGETFSPGVAVKRSATGCYTGPGLNCLPPYEEHAWAGFLSNLGSGKESGWEKDLIGLQSRLYLGFGPQSLAFYPSASLSSG